MPATKRPIPDEVEPVIAQAMLNMYLGLSTFEIELARTEAIRLGEQINKDYDKWLNEHRRRTAEQPKRYNDHRKQQAKT